MLIEIAEYKVICDYCYSVFTIFQVFVVKNFMRTLFANWKGLWFPKRRQIDFRQFCACTHVNVIENNYTCRVHVPCSLFCAIFATLVFDWSFGVIGLGKYSAQYNYTFNLTDLSPRFPSSVGSHRG